jgi:putative restriction endonuclease
MDLIAQGSIQQNFIAPDACLRDAFFLYWDRLVGGDKLSTPALPFFHLGQPKRQSSDRFWHLIPVPGKERELAAIGQIRSMDLLKQFALGAKLDSELFEALLIPKERDALRRVLIETYFAPEIRSKVVEVGAIVAETFQYSRELRDRSREPFNLKAMSELDLPYREESRSAAFRRFVVEAYRHTCAFCRIRVVTPEGRTAVEAAHIMPWRESHNDDPRNGMALCGLHHWTFDQGITSVSEDSRIMVSPVIPYDGTEGPMGRLKDQELYRPPDTFLQPADEALRWHREKRFRAGRSQRLL